MANLSDPAAKLYAQALMEVLESREALGQVYDDLQALRSLYNGDRWFREFFTSPRVDRDVKWNAVRKAFEGAVSRPVLGLLSVLIKKGRTALLDNVVDQFDRYKDLRENRIHAYVTVAEPLNEQYRDSLRRRLEAASGKSVAVHERVDPSVIGGASLRVGDKVIDRTLRTRLHALRKHLLEARG